ncbi:MAG: DUF4928 domain-containing protein [Acidobacteriia bacterium]|nr:DUF4928 domain-containing protein [Terriglobia bacterium]
MPTNLERALEAFASKHGFKGKGSLSVALVVTEHARVKGLPLDSEALLTGRRGQVLGLGKSAVQSILKRHGIERVLAAQGGRTSRGSLQNMRDYVAFLNAAHRKGIADIDSIEAYWIQCVRGFFAGKPFKLKLDSSRSLRTLVRDVLAQATRRQKDLPGMYYAGAVAQHLVGAKLDCALGNGKFEHHSHSTADAPGDRAGDFVVGDVAIHVTTAPGEEVIERCGGNLDSGYRPVLVTLQKGVAVAEGLAEHRGLGDRIDIFEIEQFVALNIYELGGFAADGRRDAVDDLVDAYNEVIDEVETDPSLRIEVRK